MDLFCSIDIGTGSARGILVDESGKVAAVAMREYPLLIPKPGWAEQNPDDWADAALDVLASLASSKPACEGKVIGLGVTGQMHGTAFLDERHHVIRPALLWCDNRTGSQAEKIEALTGGRKRLIELTGNRSLTGFSAPKLLWLKENEPENFLRLRKILLPKDYVRLVLTGETATDCSDASGTLWFDVAERKWSDQMLKSLEVDPEWLPKVFEGTDMTGTLSSRIAGITGLPKGLPVFGGGGDQAAGACGSGAVSEGDLAIQLGTSGVVFAPTFSHKPDQDGRVHAFCHAFPGAWHLMSVMLSAGGSLRWFREKLAPGASYKQLDEMAARTPCGCDGVLFLPYLAGERTPIFDPNARGAFLGLSLASGLGHLVRAVLEGVAAAMAEGLDLLIACGAKAGSAVVTGGGAASSLWLQILSDATGLTLRPLLADEGPAFGAALLAAVGCGMYHDVPTACRSWVKLGEPIVPAPQNVEGMAKIKEKLKITRAKLL